MKIEINPAGQPAGPFSKEELQDRIYSGEFPRSVPARIEGTADWIPLDVLLKNNSPAKSAADTSPVLGSQLDQLRDPKEKTALMWLYIASVPMWLLIIAVIIGTLGIFLIPIAVFWLLAAIGEMWFAAYLKTNAVRVSEKQLPEWHRVVQASCKKLEMECPEVYVMQHNVWNAFAIKIFGQRMVVLFSGAVDSILLKGDLQQLSWVVGHELGHHWAGHLDKKKKIAKLGGWVIWLKFWYSRRRELTCDRVGLFCSGSLRSSQLAMVNMTVGAQLADKVNVEQAVAQWRGHSSEFFVKYLTLYSTYPQLLARLDHLNQAGQEFGMK
jgi:Zn-dependent protease with chaperone function